MQTQIENNDLINKTFSRETVENNKNVSIVDSNDKFGLELFCYNSCNNDSDENTKQCRGMVFNGNNLVMRSFSYANEYNETQTTEIKKELGTDLNEWRVFPSYEGTLLRMFFFQDKWFLSTHRKLNAFLSKWSSRDSFGVIFEKAIQNEFDKNTDFANFLSKEGKTLFQRFENTLDKTKQYLFLVKNNIENRIVCDVSKDYPLFLHVGTVVNGTITTLDYLFPSLKLYPHLVPTYDVNNLLEIVGYMNPYQEQGFICFRNSDGKQIKILNSKYQELCKIRNNEPSLKFRYLQVRMDEKMTNSLYELYPNYAKYFDEYENTIRQISNYIYRSYVDRFIKKQLVKLPKQEFLVMKDCHNWHVSDREHNKISLPKVFEFMNMQASTNINQMVKRFLREKNQTENSQTE